MSEIFRDYLPILIVALVIGAIVGWLLFRPRQHVRLSADTAPVRPHMAVEPRRPLADPVPSSRVVPRGGRGIADEAATAVGDVSGEILRTPAYQDMPDAADDLRRLKGVGPKFVTLLHSQGLFRFEQIARLTPTEVERIDSAMGAFRGRFTRDRIVDQADYLSRGDEDGYERQFGKL